MANKIMDLVLKSIEDSAYLKSVLDTSRTKGITKIGARPGDESVEIPTFGSALVSKNLGVSGGLPTPIFCDYVDITYKFSSD